MTEQSNHPLRLNRFCDRNQICQNMTSEEIKVFPICARSEATHMHVPDMYVYTVYILRTILNNLFLSGQAIKKRTVIALF